MQRQRGFFNLFRWARPTSISGFSGVRACVRASVRAEFRVRKVVEADLTMMMKTKVIRYDELTPKTHGLPTLDPTWAK